MLREDVPRFLALGCCVFGSQFFYLLGLELTSATTVAVLQPAIPVFTTLMAVVVGYERVRLAKLLGVACATGGAVYMVCALCGACNS